MVIAPVHHAARGVAVVDGLLAVGLDAGILIIEPGAVITSSGHA